MAGLDSRAVHGCWLSGMSAKLASLRNMKVAGLDMSGLYYMTAQWICSMDACELCEEDK